MNESTAARRAVDDLRDALALATVALPPGSRFRPWLDRIELELLELHADLAGPETARRITPAHVVWLEVRLAEVRREPTPWAAFPSRVAPTSIRLRRAALLARRAARLTHRAPASGSVHAYLAVLGALLAALARAAADDATVRIRLEATCAPRPVRHRLAPG